MNVLCRIWNSSLGKKYIMALTGVILALFVCGHLVGNLQMFLGAEALNRYAHFLQSNVEMLWPVRMVMLTVITLHIITALRLTLDNRAARPVDYSNGQPPYKASFASRMMLIGGLVVACFIVYHLLHYTVKTEAVNFGAGDFHGMKEMMKDGAARADVFKMVIAGFSQGIASLIYVIGISLLCYHVSHGIGAMFQSLGLKNHVYGPLIDKVSIVVAIALFVGYCLIPTAILLGFGKSHMKETSAKIPTVEIQK